MPDDATESVATHSIILIISKACEHVQCFDSFSAIIPTIPNSHQNKDIQDQASLIGSWQTS